MKITSRQRITFLMEQKVSVELLQSMSTPILPLLYTQWFSFPRNLPRYLDLQPVFERIRERVIDKYELGNVEGLDSRGFAEAEHRARLPTTPTLQELAKVATTMHVLNKGAVSRHIHVIVQHYSG